jgi:hypothetical protein
MPQLQQVIVMLPEPLVAFLKRAAEREDRTLSGALRHLVSEAARVEPRPEGVLTFPTMPGVAATAEGIAAAKERVAAMREEQARIRRKKRTHGTSADEDTRADRFIDEIATMEQRIVSAEKMLPRRNGG